MYRDTARFLRALGVMLALCVLTGSLSGCEQDSAHLEEDAADEFPELTFGHEELLESWSLEGEHYVSPRLEAPLGATRVGVLLATLDAGEAMPDLEVRGLDAGSPGSWTPIRNTWSEEGMHVGIADLPSGATSVQVRIAASSIDLVDMIKFNAVIPEPGEDDFDGTIEFEEAAEATGELAVATEELRSDLASLGVRSRAQWGARATRCTTRDRSKYRFAIHHTVSPQTGNVPAMIRGFQRYHMDSNRWCDIGYHFLVGADGTVYEGRPLDLLGSHVGNNNSGNIGISFVGCFDGSCPRSTGSRTPNDRAIRGAAKVMNRLARIYGISISSRNTLGHRQHSGASTACPGSQLLSRLDTLRSLARSGVGSSGSGSTSPSPTPAPAPSSSGTVVANWSRGSGGNYTFTATAPSSVARVDYYVDGWRIGTVRRSASSSFSIRYKFSSETRNRRFEARGFNSSGTIVARGYGLIEPVPGPAVAIRQTGRASYEFSIERAPSNARTIEVSVDDGFVLRDSVSNSNRPTRLAVRYQFVGLRSRPFRIRLFDGSGNVVRTERRTFTLR